MATKREVTQFSVVEAKAFEAEKREPKNDREKHMAAFLAAVAERKPEDFARWGGFDNIQRIRVIDCESKTTYEFVTKLPPALVEEKKRQAEREARKKAVLARVEELRKDPKAFNKYVREVVADIIGRAFAAALLGSVKTSKPKPAQKARRPERKPRDAYEAALQQDRRNRIEASKAAAAAYHGAKKVTA